MRVMSWNTSWNCSSTRIVRQVAAVGALDADVAFFSEWSPLSARTTSSGTTISNSHHVRTEQLGNLGLINQVHEHSSSYAGRTDGEWARLHWGILVASRQPIRKVPVDNPTFAPGTWLEVDHEQSGLRLVSVRVPAWEGNDVGLRRELWEWMLTQFERLQGLPALVLGDFNTEASYPAPHTARLFGADLMAELTTALSWTDLAVATNRVCPTITRNNGRTSRIDYAFASPSLRIDGLDYSAPTSVGPHQFVGGKATSPLSDHAPVVVDASASALMTMSEASGRIGVGSERTGAVA